MSEKNIEETVSIVIKKFSNGEIETSVESKGPIDISELLGILEFSKMDFMINHKDRQMMKQELEKHPKVKVKLTKKHFEILPALQKEGFKVGDDYELPEPIFNQIKQMIEN